MKLEIGDRVTRTYRSGDPHYEILDIDTNRPKGLQIKYGWFEGPVYREEWHGTYAGLMLDLLTTDKVTLIKNNHSMVKIKKLNKLKLT